MKQVLSNVKVSEVPSLMTHLGFDPNQMVNLTIESAEEDVLTVMDRIGKKAQEKGLTEEILADLLENESYRTYAREKTREGQRSCWRRNSDQGCRAI